MNARQMNAMQAFGIIEGLVEASHEEAVEAAGVLVASGVAATSPGRIGRACEALLTEEDE